MNREQTGSIGLSGLLLLLFIGLKLTGHIDWPWLWVLAPFWIPFGIAICAITFFLIMAGIQKALGRQ